jgi:hypothetical protein
MGTIDLSVDNLGPCPEFEHGDDTMIRGLMDSASASSIPIGLGHRQRRSFRLNWDRATEGQIELLKIAFGAAGSSKRVNYIPPDETEIVECYLGALEYTRNSAVSWSASLALTEAKR